MLNRSNRTKCETRDSRSERLKTLHRFAYWLAGEFDHKDTNKTFNSFAKLCSENFVLATVVKKARFHQHARCPACAIAQPMTRIMLSTLGSFESRAISQHNSIDIHHRQLVTERTPFICPFTHRLSRIVSWPDAFTRTQESAGCLGSDAGGLGAY